MQAEAEEKPATPPRRSKRVSARTQEPDSPLREGWGNGEVADTMRDADGISHDEEENDEEEGDGEDGQAEFGA